MIGIFGGSFDPPHKGHESIIREYWNHFSESRLLYIVPNWQSPLKEQRTTPLEHILTMTKILLQSIDNEKNHLLDYEITKKEKCYTIDTIRYIQSLNDERINLVIGSDQLEKFHLWKDYQTILTLIHKLVVFPRSKEHCFNEKIGSNEKIITMKHDPIEISSTQLRNKLSYTLMNQYLHPDIAAYIIKQELYPILE